MYFRSEGIGVLEPRQAIATATTRPEVPVRAERFRAALQTRVLGRAGLGEAGNVRAMILEKGEAVLLSSNDAVLPMSGPVMGWFPWREGMRLELAAGAQGTHLLLGIVTLNRVLQRHAEATQLRFLVERPAFIRLGGDNAAGDAVAACFNGVLRETLTPGPMSSAVVESLLHVLLVHLHRGQPTSNGAGSEAGSITALAERFRVLVEGHFRDRWTVARYAAELGISRDRLNDICIRAHGRPPARLIRERLMLEARIYLENSPLALGQIADVLGFAGASQFNRVFKALQGRSPGRYREEQRRLAKAGSAPAGAPYAWP
jgi:AraC-type DNA-binding domain-containing proteins